MLLLEGVRVVEIGQNIAGPYAGTILADFGADVVKIEKPDGDDARAWTVRTGNGPVPLAFHVLNHSKKSVVVDFKNPAEMARLHDYLKTVDILIHNLRPGLADELGLGAAAMLKLNPRLVYCEVGAFGHRGPLARKPGYEPLGHAYAGIMAINGEPEGQPLRAGCSIIDPGTGMWTALGALAALRRRDQTGQGCVVNTSLLETGLTWVYQPAANYLLTGEEPPRLGNGSPTLVPYQSFDTATAPIMICPGNNRLFAKLCAVLGRPELPGDPRFATVADRVANRETIIGIVQEELRKQPLEHWRAALDAVGVPNAPINTVGQAAEDAQTRALGMVIEEPETGYAMFGLPVSFDGERPAVRTRAPKLGEHTEAVLGAR